MKYFVVKYLHTDMEGWKKHVNGHIEYLEEMIRKGKIIVSGPVQDSKINEKEAILIFYCKDRTALHHLIEEDPYWYEGLVADYTINEWDPMFGSFQARRHRFMIQLSKWLNK